MHVLYIVMCLLAISTACHSNNVTEKGTTVQTILQNLDNRNKSVQAECGGLVTSSEGYLTSPQFPQSIPVSYTDCSWVVIGAVHTIVHLRFQIIDLPPPSPVTGECLGGHVTYGQYDFDHRQVTEHRYCGTEFPPVFVSYGHRAWLTFVSTGKTLQPELYEGVKVEYRIVDTDFMHNQLIVGVVGGLVVPLSCVVAMTYYVRKITRRKRREEREQEYMRMLKYRANDERRERRRQSQFSNAPDMVLPEQHNEDIRVVSQCPQTKAEPASEPESETRDGEDEDPNNNKIGFSTFLRNIIDSQSTEASEDVTEASSNLTSWSSTAHTSTKQDRWSFPDSSTGSDHTIVPSSAQAVFYLSPDSQDYDPTSKFTVPSPGVSVKLTWSAMQDYAAFNTTISGGPWEDSEFYFPPSDGTDAYEERTSSLPMRLLTQGVVQTNICQSAPNICTVTSSGKRTVPPSGNKSKQSTRYKDRVYLETIC